MSLVANLLLVIVFHWKKHGLTFLNVPKCGRNLVSFKLRVESTGYY